MMRDIYQYNNEPEDASVQGPIEVNVQPQLIISGEEHPDEAVQMEIREEEIESEGTPVFEYSASPEIEPQPCCCEQPDEPACKSEESGAEPCDRFVPFCCIKEVPEGLKSVPVSAFRAVYDPSGLNCCVEECTASVITPCNCPHVTAPLYAVRIVGCIPVSVNVEGFVGKCGIDLVCGEEERRISLCCNDTVCVNNIVCYKGKREEAEEACKAIRNDIRFNPCKAVTIHNIRALDLNPVLGECGCKKSILVISGKFLLPGCMTK